MADHSKFYSGGTQRQSSKESRSTAHCTEAEGSQSIDKKASRKRSSSKHSKEIENRTTDDRNPRTNSDIAEPTRRTLRSIGSSPKNSLKEPEREATTSSCQTVDIEKITDADLKRKSSETRGRIRKRSLPTPRPVAGTSVEVGRKRLKRSSDHFLSPETDGEFSTPVLSGIRASLRSNPQAELLKGLSPVRRRSLSVASSTTTRLPSTSAEADVDEVIRVAQHKSSTKSKQKKKIKSQKQERTVEKPLPKKRLRLDKSELRGSDEVGETNKVVLDQPKSSHNKRGKKKKVPTATLR